MSRIVTVRSDQTVRLAEIGELTALAYLADGLLDAAHPFVPDLRNAKARAEQAILLMMADGDDGQGAAVGTLTVVPAGSPFGEFAQEDEYELRMLAVSPLARGRGVGRYLTSFGLDLAVREGAKRVALSTMEDMRAAHRLYENLGFVRQPERDWVAHASRSKVRCDASCLDASGLCTQEGRKLLAYGWEPS